MIPPPKTLFALAAALTIFDALSTYVLVTTGIAREANPLLALMVGHYGIGYAMTMRVVIGIGLLVALRLLTGQSPLVQYGLILVTGALGLVGLVHVRGLGILLMT